MTVGSHIRRAHVTRKEAFEFGAASAEYRMERLREQAKEQDDYDPERKEAIRGGGFSREHYAMEAAWLGGLAGRLRELADAEESP